ncbi:hypothetical protein MMC20_003169 [Loxospora ochrophaea]|nr:hypothetical protein [Loxospora ochrophaea]
MDDTGYVRHVPSNSILLSAFKAGAFSGAAGVLFGTIAGSVRPIHAGSVFPGIFALASGLQWFALGTSRGFIFNAWENEKMCLNDKIYASGIAGGISGASVGGLTRGRANVLPGAIVFSVLGLVGEKTYQYLDGKHSRSIDPALESGSSIWQKIAIMKWSPMKILSDEEYEEMLRQKLLRVNAEVSVIEDDIESLRKSQFTEIERIKDSAESGQ